MKIFSRARSTSAGFAFASLFAAAFLSSSAFAQNQNWNAPIQYKPTYTVGISGAYIHSDTNFAGTGSASGTVGAICVDGTAEFWNSMARYAGEFAGFRVAAAGSLCQGFGRASDPVGSFDGRTALSTFMTGGGRVSFVTGGNIIPYAGIGGVYAHTKVEAFPFESNNSWRPGWYWEVGAVIPIAPQNAMGTGIVQNIDRAAAELYLAYKHLDTGEQTLSGGAKANAEFDLFLVGLRTRY